MEGAKLLYIIMYYVRKGQKASFGGNGKVLYFDQFGYLGIYICWNRCIHLKWEHFIIYAFCFNKFELTTCSLSWSQWVACGLRENWQGNSQLTWLLMVCLNGIELVGVFSLFSYSISLWILLERIEWYYETKDKTS